MVDTGYSFTHVVPYINGTKCSNGIQRLHIGGKVSWLNYLYHSITGIILQMLTNHMKDILSYRQYHVMEETYVINQVKEDTCFVSENFKADLKIASQPFPTNHIVRNYILPDFNTIRRGWVNKKPIQIIVKINVDKYKWYFKYHEKLSNSNRFEDLFEDICPCPFSVLLINAITFIRIDLVT